MGGPILILIRKYRLDQEGIAENQFKSRVQEDLGLPYLRILQQRNDLLQELVEPSSDPVWGGVSGPSEKRRLHRKSRRLPQMSQPDMET
jgi:hypothetical protein